MQLKLLNRIATVKNDGTVEFNIPLDVEPRVIDSGSQDLHSEVAGDESVDLEFQYIPPMQIVMLIVGTRGDVQPFVAIGKRLQVREICHFLSQLVHRKRLYEQFMQFFGVLLKKNKRLS